MKKQFTGQVTFSSGKLSDLDVWTYDLESGEICQVTTGTDLNAKPCFSADGKWITFTSNRAGGFEVFKAPSQGGEAIQLTDMKRWCDSPRFSPDSTKIAFISNENGNNDIWIMDADGKNRTQITEHNGSDCFVDWTPDGKGLLFSSDREDNFGDIWYWDLSSDQKTQLTSGPSGDYNPVASPCGMYIAFVSNRQREESTAKPYEDRDKDIWLMGADGSNLVCLTKSQGCDQWICWSPCGKHIMYASSNDTTSSHLRIMDVSSVIDAFETRNGDAIEKAADRVRNEEVKLNRDALKEEIGAKRTTNFLTAMLPEKFVEACCYTPGYFGHEKYPHWIDATPSQASERNPSELKQTS